MTNIQRSSIIGTYWLSYTHYLMSKTVHDQLSSFNHASMLTRQHSSFHIRAS